MMWQRAHKNPTVPPRYHEDTTPIILLEHGYHRGLSRTYQMINETILPSMAADGSINLSIVLEHSRQTMSVVAVAVLFIDPRGRLFYHTVENGTTEPFQDVTTIEEEGIPLRLLKSGRASLIEQDVYANPHFRSTFDEKTGFRSKSMAVAVLKNKRGTATGALVFLNKVSDTGAATGFTHFDSDVLPVVGAITSMALLL